MADKKLKKFAVGHFKIWCEIGEAAQERLPVDLADVASPSVATVKRKLSCNSIVSETREDKAERHKTDVNSAHGYINPGWDLCGWEEIGASYGRSGRQARRDNPPHDIWLKKAWSCVSSMTQWLKTFR